MESKELLDNIQFSSPNTIDAKLYKGIKVPIASVDIEEVTDYYTGAKDADGKPTYNKDSTEKKKVVYVTTEPIPKLDASGNPTSEKTDIVVKRRFNLKKEVNETTGEVTWTISKADKAELWAFMRNLEVDKLSDLIGRLVVLTAVADKDDPKKFWLRISD